MFISSTRGTHEYLERGISPKIQGRRFGENQSLWVRKCFQDFLSVFLCFKGRDPSYLCLFSTFGRIERLFED